MKLVSFKQPSFTSSCAVIRSAFVGSSNRDAVWPTATQPPLCLSSKARNRQRVPRMNLRPLVIRLSLFRPVSRHPSRGFWRRRDLHFRSSQVPPATVDQDRGTISICVFRPTGRHHSETHQVITGRGSKVFTR